MISNVSTESRSFHRSVREIANSLSRPFSLRAIATKRADVTRVDPIDANFRCRLDRRDSKQFVLIYCVLNSEEDR